MLKVKRSDRWHWLIVMHLTSTIDVFTIHPCGDGKALPVFSFQEESEMFLDVRLVEEQRCNITA